MRDNLGEEKEKRCRLCENKSDSGEQIMEEMFFKMRKRKELPKNSRWNIEREKGWLRKLKFTRVKKNKERTKKGRRKERKRKMGWIWKSSGTKILII